MKILINCCCDAGLTLGSVEVPDGLEDKSLANFIVDGAVLSLPLATIGLPPFTTSMLAIKSMDTPLETLQKIPGFLTINKQLSWKERKELVPDQVKARELSKEDAADGLMNLMFGI